MVRTYTISHEDIKYALYQLLSEFESADNEWYCITGVYDDHFVAILPLGEYFMREKKYDITHKENYYAE